MRKSFSMTLLGAAALAMTLGACNQTNKAAASSDPDSVKNALKADEAQMNKQLKAGDLEGVASHYADDAYFVAPGVPGTQGSTPIRQVFANASTDQNFKLTFGSDDVGVSSSGDMAYTRGHYTEQYTDKKTGKVMTNSGSYLTVYKKQDDGSWKIVEDFAAADPDSTKPVPPQKPAVRAKMTSFG